MAHAFLRLVSRPALLLPFIAAVVVAAPPPVRAGEPVDVAALVAAMTLEEKLALLRGAADPEALGNAGYIAGVPRLGIPPLRSVDGPAGIEARADATALPVPEALAASFDPALAERYGRVLGREARALGMDVVLAPHINVARLPVFHRIKDELGEDPFLTAVMGVGEIHGIQAEGAMAEAKHLAANDQLLGQDTADFRISERTLAEIQLPPFEAAVREAGVASVMCAYNRVNGPFSCAQKTLMTDFLRDRWGFDGFVTSDWNGARSSAFDAGLDVEMPGTYVPSWYGRLAARAPRDPAVARRIDRAVGRVLGQMRRFGLLDGASPTGGTARVPPRPSLDRDASAAVAREVAASGAVLLKNDGLLPLAPTAAAPSDGGLLIIGPTGDRLAAGVGVERAYGFRDRFVAPLDALRRVMGPEAKIEHRVGIDLDGEVIPAERLTWSDDADATDDGAPVNGAGLVRQPAEDPDGDSEVDRVVDFTGPNAFADGGDWAWAGLLTVPTTGIYDLKLETSGGSAGIALADRLASSARIGINGGPARPWTGIVPTRDGLDVTTLRARLVAGHAYQIKLTARSVAGSPLAVRFAWVTPEMRGRALREAVEAASRAATVIVFAHEDGLPPDRETLALPLGQDDLIAAVAAANPRTAVVLAAGRPVTMPWLDRVKAVLLSWYPGQEGGPVLADLLTGRLSPSGRLPLTFPASDAQTPARDDPGRYRIRDDAVRYDEGLLVGYRWYDAMDERPLFPFGFGLSYGRFAWTDPAIGARGDGAEVAVSVTNRGERADADVVQVYVGADPDAAEPRAEPPRRLAGFARVALAPGETKRVVIPLDRRRFEVWSTASHAWHLPSGRREIAIAASSRDIRFVGALAPDASAPPVAPIAVAPN